MNWFRKKDRPARPERKRSNVGNTKLPRVLEPGEAWDQALARAFPVPSPQGVNADGSTFALDSAYGPKAIFNNFQQTVPDSLALWYASQSFIGYQMCAMIAQHWLVSKACFMPGEDAVRKGYEVSVPDDIEVDPSKLAALKEMDKRFGIIQQMQQAVGFCRIFGIRVIIFNVNSTDPEYYAKPFNPDGVTPGSYTGITQVDPYWITPELDTEAAANPASPNFYVPTWWRVNGKRYHRSHLVVLIENEVADILKPSYFYGGVSVPQKIYERVYAAERTANEAPLLAQSKRLTALYTDLTEVEANKEAFAAKIAVLAEWRDNFGVKVNGVDDRMEQFDTSLADYDSVTMTQYQLVSAASDVPSTKLLGTAPKGLNATGEYDESSYHEKLESIQSGDLTPILDRHHLLCIRSEISPGSPFPTVVSWNALDAPTALEEADLNNKKADTASKLFTIGAIDGIDERQRLTIDPDSGYANLPTMDREIEPIEGNEENDDDAE